MIKRWICLVTCLLALAAQAFGAERRDLPGGWYVDALPNREYVALIGNSHLESSAGRVGLPNGQNVLCVRIARGGRFAGAGHVDDQAWLFQAGSGWSSHGLAHGVCPVIFDAGGALRVADPTIGSQGFRYVDASGRIWTGDETYADVARHLWEYTTHGNITCGQGGDEEGLQCLIDGRRVLVEPGVVRFVHVNRDGPRLAISWMAPIRNTASILWLEEHELRAYPTYVLPGGAPPPPPPPPPTTVPDRKAFAAAFLSSRLTRQESHDATRAHSFAALNALALALAATDDRWGLLEKKGGARVRDRASDVLLYRISATHAQVVDAIKDAEGASGNPAPAWTVKDIRPIAQWKAPFPDVDHPPPPPDLTARVEALEAQLTVALRRLKELDEWIGGLTESVDHLEAWVDAREPVLDEARVKQILDEALAQLKVNVGRTLGHSHRAEIVR